MKKWILGVIIAASVVAFLVIVLFGTWLWITRRPYPKTRGRITVEGVSAPVEIYRDRYGVPHIYAQTAEDLFFAQGFVHAQDRFWQMEFWRRLGAGRLSELFGKKLLDTDKFLRTMGFTQVAEKEYQQSDRDTRRYLDAYATGVNAYILNRKPIRLGLEFALLEIQGVDFEIEPWTPVHTLTWDKMMSYDLGSNFKSERTHLEVLQTIGLPRWLDLYAPYRPDMPFVFSDEELTHLGASGSDVQNKARQVFGSSGIGSNAWVISGKRTATGKPLLANDMHLGIQMPSIWYEIGLHGITPDGKVGSTSSCPFHMRGYSFPGVPGIIAGHNEHIAWGLTNLAGDVQDLFIERINPENPDQYEVNGQWVDMDIRYEEIKIHKEEEPYVLRVRHTRHGPIISDHGGYERLNTYYILPDPDKEFPENVGFTVLSLRWTALDPGRLTQAIFLLDQASNFDEFREALSYWDVPGQNVVYADTEGNIGYQAPGRYPIRARGMGLAPVPGWTDEYEWLGFAPFEELPYVLNPAKGYIVSANNPVVSPNYPYPQGSGFAFGFRARRITEMIEGDTDGISVEDIAVMQADTFNQAASEIVSYLEGLNLDIPDEEEEEEEESERERRKREEKEREELEVMQEARERLLEWDARMEIDSPEAAFYGYFWIKLVEETFKDQYPESRWPHRDQSQLQNAFYYLLQDPNNEWWDDLRTPEKRETRDEILVRAFRKGYRAAVERLGEKLDSWRWGKVHTAEFRNQTFGQSGIAPIEAIFNRGPVEVRGSFSLVSVASWEFEEPFEVYHISSQRAIYDLGNLADSLLMHTTGQSGHATHRHYDDFIEPWRKIEYHTSLWEREAVEDASRAKLLLKPE